MMILLLNRVDLRDWRENLEIKDESVSYLSWIESVRLMRLKICKIGLMSLSVRFRVCKMI